MADISCLSCGRPLGSQDSLCYTCRQNGNSVTEVIDPVEHVIDRVERYVLVSAVRCSNCGEVHGEVTTDGQVYTADDFGIETESEWKREMEKEEAWIKANVTDVRHALPVLEDEWPQTVQAIRNTIL